MDHFRFPWNEAFHFFDMAAVPLTRGKRLLRLSLGLPLGNDEGKIKKWIKIVKSSLRNVVDLIGETLLKLQYQTPTENWKQTPALTRLPHVFVKKVRDASLL